MKVCVTCGIEYDEDWDNCVYCNNELIHEFDDISGLVELIHSGEIKPEENKYVRKVVDDWL